MNISELIELLNKSDIVVKSDGDKLLIHSPQSIEEDVQALIKKYKQELLSIFNTKEKVVIQKVSFSESGYVLSPAQNRLWILAQYENVGSAYNMPWIFNWKGSLDIAKLRDAYHRLIRDHESLRTTFGMNESGQLRQFVHSFKEESFPLDCITFNAGEKTNNLIQLAQSEVNRFISESFDLNSLPLMRAKVFQYSKNEYIIAFCLHHIIADGRSINILQRDLLSYYEQDGVKEAEQDSDSNVTYKDFSNWHAGFNSTSEALKSHAYWSQNLNSTLPQFEVLGAKSRPTFQTFSSQMRTIHISEAHVNRLMDLSAERKGTLYITLFSLVTLALNQMIVQNEIVIGCPVDGRFCPEIEDVVGYFVNVLPVHINLSEELSYNQLYEVLKERILGAIQNQNYALDEFVDFMKIKRDKSRNTFFDVVVTMDFQEDGSYSGNSQYQISEYPHNLDFNDSKFDLTFGFSMYNGDLHFTLKYNSDIYDIALINSLVENFEKLALGKIDFYNCKISEIEWVEESERKIVLDTNLKNIQITNTDNTILSVFELQVSKNLKAVALVFENESWTYEQLNAKANAFAFYIRDKHGVSAGDFVGVELGRSNRLILTLLSILKVGAAYVPINPEYPYQRKQFIIEDAKLNIIINDTEFEYFSQWSCQQKNQFKYPNFIISSSDIAYIMYTSGSTGHPKGVLVEHKNVVRLICNPNYINLDSSDRLLQTGAIEFDASTFEIWGVLANGGQLHILSNELVKNPDSIKSYITEKAITLMWFTASYFDSLVLSHISIFEGLKKIIVGGSALTPTLVKKLKNKFSDLIIINGYGPTENTTFSLTYEINDVEDNIPIGKPVGGSSAYVFNKFNKLTPVGSIGEICVGGLGLARGYLNNSDLTVEKFFPNPYNPSERLYKTGDFGRIRSDGNFEFQGRIDEQVKIRGYRIESGEIEQRLMEYPSAGHVAVIVRELSISSEKELIAYYTGKATIEELKIYLKQWLPSYMVPNFFIKVDSIPLTKNGKLDRASLPNPEAASLFKLEYFPPTTEVEKLLTKIWSKVLGIVEESISVKTDFFDIGGHSIKVIRLLGDIYRNFKVKISFKDFFANSTIEQLGAVISVHNLDTAYDSIPLISTQSDYALSSSQKRLWVMSKFEGASEAYHIPQVFRMSGILNDSVFIRAYQFLLERHEVLRTVFTEDLNGNPRQRILLSSDERFKIKVLDYSQASQADANLTIHNFIVSEVQRGFDMSSGPLIRCSLLRESSNSYIWVLVLHHIVSDGWSMGVLHRDFVELYNSELESRQAFLSDLPIQHKDYAAWHNTQLASDVISDHKKFWLDKFAGELPILDLASDLPRPKVMTYRGATLYRTLDKSTTDQLRLFGQQQGGTMFMTLQAALNILLHKYTGQEDIVIGSPIAGRDQPELEGQIGFYVNTLPLRNSFSKEDTVGALYQKIKQNTLECYSHQLYPYDELVEALGLIRDVSRNPLFDVMITYQSLDGNDNDVTFLNIEVENYNTTASEYEVAKFDLTFGFDEHIEGMGFSINYNIDIYCETHVNRMIDHLEYLLKTLSFHSSIPITQYDILSKSEKTFLLDTLNSTQASYPENKTILDLFEAQVERTPGAIAVKYKNIELSYQLLNEYSNQFAHYLIDCYQIQADELVGIELDRSEWMIIVILGIMKAGGAYVPIDPAYPEERKNFIRDDAQLKVIVNDNELNKYREVKSKKEYSNSNLNVNLTSENLIYVIYTSGSTGNPKGCMLEHRGLVNRLNWMQKTYPLNVGDCIIQKTTFTFDVSVWELVWWSLQGACVTLLEPGEEKNPEKILDMVLDKSVTVIHFVPSMLTVFLEYLESSKNSVNKLKNLRQVYTSGEMLLPEHVKQFKKLLPTTRLMNLYGPTEASIDVSYFSCDEKCCQLIPIGKPIDNTELIILNSETLKLVPFGSVGEICIGGIGLARGYINRDDLTLEKFIENPYHSGNRLYRTGDLGRWREDGNLEYLGRTDDQVKIRGYRIELGEIEQALSTNSNSGQTCVIARAFNKSSEKELVVYFTGTANPEELRLHLNMKLPHYMVPKYYVKLDQIPLTNNGKLDRKSLPNPERTGIDLKTYIEPKTETEKILHQIWKEVLGDGEQSIGINSDFFSVGGNSIKAIRIISRVQRAFEIKLMVSDFFINSDLESLGILIDNLREVGKSNFEFEL